MSLEHPEPLFPFFNTKQPISNRNTYRSSDFGLLGTGKTTDAVHHMLMFHLLYPKFPIYTNLKIKGLRTIPIDDPEVLFLINEPSFVLPDEFWQKANSHKRDSLNDAVSLVSLRSRKKGWCLHYTVQLPTQIEKRIRFVTEIWREPFFDENTGISKIKIYLQTGKLLSKVYYDAWYVQKFFNSYDDPLDMDIDRLLDAYRRHKHDRF